MTKRNVGRKARAGNRSEEGMETNEHIVQLTSLSTGSRQTNNLAWTGLQKEFGDQLQDIIGAQRKRMMDIGQKITRLSAEIAPVMEPVGPSQSTIEEITRTWEKYQPEMNDRIQNLLNSGNGTFENINSRWAKLSSSMQKAVASLGNAKDLPTAREDLFDAWLDLSREMSSLFTEGVSNGSDEFKRLRKTWSDLMKDMNQLAMALQDQNPMLANTMEKLSKSSTEINRELMDYWAESFGQMQRLQNLWTTRMSDASLGLMSTMLDANRRVLEETPKRNGHRNI